MTVLPPIQAWHQTETDYEKVLACNTEMETQHVCYSSSKSYHLPEGTMLSDEAPISVFNKGTRKYEMLGLDRLVGSLNIMALVTAYLMEKIDNQNAESKRPKRGNIVVPFGIAGGQNVGVQNWREELTKKNYGVNMPRSQAGTLESHMGQTHTQCCR
jgi:hypothetical protein